MARKKYTGAQARRAWLWLLISLLLALGLVSTGSTVGADELIPISTPGEPTQWSTTEVGTLVDTEDLGQPSKGRPKLGASLNQLLEAQRREGPGGAQAFAEAHKIVLDDKRVQVVVVTTPEAISDLKAAVEALGGEYQGHYETRLQALVPVDALESLAGRSKVQFIREPRRPMPMAPLKVGSQTTEGVAASNASAWHGAGYDGTGVRVAIIDGGFTNYSGLLGTDLPASLTTYDWTGTGMGGSEHGTACAEIVYDMAPGVTMELHKVSTDVELGNAVDQAIADGVDIISMSLGWTLDGPGDGTGFLANIVDNARANGVFFAVAAGNEAEVSWSGRYVDNASVPGTHEWPHGGNVNCFGPGTPDYTCYNIPAGYPISISMHWDDWAAVTQDYDLVLLRWTGSAWTTVETSADLQNGGAGQTPEEIIRVAAPSTAPYGILIKRSSASRDVCLSLDSSKMEHLDEWAPGRSLMFPADSPDAITVGAVDVSSHNLESYSSRGPTFGSGGTCSGGAIKPDLAAYANVSTVSYGSQGFNGTSSATPHVAGAAALVKEAHPSYSVSQLQSYLENEAIDLGTSGKDNLYGWGRLHLPDVNNPPPTTEVPSPTTQTPTPTATQTPSPTDEVNGIYLPITVKQSPNNPPTPTKTPEPGLPMPGDWSGITDQDYPVSFTVASDRISVIEFYIKYHLSCQYGSVTKSGTITGNWSITDSKFAISSLGAIYEGTFTSTTSAHGTWSDSYDSPQVGHCSGSGAWTADWQ